MAYTTLPGASAADKTSFIGTNGVDNLNLSNFGNEIFLEAREANDSFTFVNSSGSIANAVLKGGSGNDNFRTPGSTAIVNTFVNTNSGFDTIDIANVTSSTVQGGQGIDKLKVGLITNARINGNKGTDNIEAIGGNNASIHGGQGNDVTTLTGDYINSIVEGDNDDDLITLGITTTLDQTSVNGDAGSDTINVNAISSFGLSTLAGGEGTDQINATNSTVGVFSIGNQGNDTLIGGTAADSLNGGSGNDNITGGVGADIMNGGEGNDTFTFGITATDVVAGETINAGSGTQDAIFVNTNSTNFSNLTTATLATAGGIEIIRVTSGLTATFTAAQVTGQTLTLQGTAAAGNSTVVVNALAAPLDLSNLAAGANFTSGTDILTINATALTNANITGSGSAETIVGNTGNDILLGGAANDSISGNNGTDSITGGIGNDAINLNGTGSDRVIYTATGDGGDTLTNFLSGAAAGADVVAFTSAGFAGAAAAGTAAVTNVGVTAAGTANAARISIGTTAQLQTLNAASANRFFVDTTANTLVYDGDGNFNSAGDQTVLANVGALLDTAAAGNIAFI